MVFILDTETSGRVGIPLWHANNRLLQVCILHEESGDIFKHYIKYDDSFFVTPESTKIHGISNLTLASEGISPKVVLEKMLQWVTERCPPDDSPQVIAHNAHFDRDVLRIAIFRELGLDFGRGGREWNWRWYCTILAARELLPDPGLELFPEEQPYSLGVLYNFYFNEKPDGLHNAVRDVQALRRLYNEIILPKLTTDELKEKFRVGGAEKKGRLALLRSVPGYADARTSAISTQLCREFAQEGTASGLFDFSKFAHPPGLLTVGHLLLYGQMRYMQKIRRKEAQGEKLTVKDQCVWFEIAKSVECLLREGLGLSSDRVIGELVAKVCNRDIVDLVLHTAREDGTLQFFPTMRGEPISYLPLKVSVTEANSLLEGRGWGTISEIVAAWQTVEHTHKARFYQEVNSCLYKSIPDLEYELVKVLNYS